MDVLTPEQRRKNMSMIKAKNTKPELLLRKRLFSSGIRYRLHYPLPGKPDLVIVKHRTAVFVDGCFWHRCPKHYTPPTTRQQFWHKKTTANVNRDEIVSSELRRLKWHVVRVWEHEILTNVNKACRKVLKAMNRNHHAI